MAAKLTRDMEEFLDALNRRETRYLVVGAHAVNAYTEPRTTKDLDVWIEPTSENAGRAVAAMKDFGAPKFVLDEKTMADKDTFFILGHRDGPNRIDVLKEIPGVEFAACWENRRLQVLDSVTFPIPSPTDLLTAKLAAGRHQDLADAEKLRVAIELEQRLEK